MKNNTNVSKSKSEMAKQITELEKQTQKKIKSIYYSVDLVIQSIEFYQD